MDVRTASLVYLLHRLTHDEIEQNGRPFECLWCSPGDDGTVFQIRHIGDLRVDEAMLQNLVDNFHRFDQSPPRCPIEVNHSGGSGDPSESKAVGWIMDLSMEKAEDRTSLMVHPHWSDQAKQIIEDGGFRFCSVGIDMNDVRADSGEKIGPHLVEVSLTGHPAIPELRSIELSIPMDVESRARVAVLRAMGPDGEPDMLELAMKIAMSFMDAYPDSGGTHWDIEAVYLEARQMVVTEHVHQIGGEGAQMGSHTWRLGFDLDESGVSFSPREEWEEVRNEFVPVEEAAAAVQELQHAAEGLGTSEQRATEKTEMELEAKLRELLKLDAAGDIVQAVTACITKVAELLSQIEQLEGKLKASEASVSQTGQQLTDRERQMVTLSGRADQADAKVVQLAARVESLEKEKRQAEGEAAIKLAIESRRMAPAEVDGDDAPMRKIAMTDSATFAAIMARRPPAESLTVELSTDGEAETKVEPSAFWKLVRDKRSADENLSSQAAQKLVLSEHQEYEVLFSKPVER